MSQFDYWQSWGAELNDTEFANAWAALGVVWADMQLGRARGATPRLGLAKIITPGPAPQELLWKFPEAPRAQELIGGTQPREWAVAWSETAGNTLIRLLVRDSPRGEPGAPWQRLLSETNPPVASVDIDGTGGTLAAPPPRVTAPPQAPSPPSKSIFSWLRTRRPAPPTTKTPAPDRKADPAPQAQPMPEAAPPPGPRTGAKSKPGGGSTPPMSTGEAGGSAAPIPRSAPRFLQQQSFAQHQGEMRKAEHGFIAGKPARVRVFIGLPKASWNASTSAFPAHELPQNEEKWTLNVWLTEPEHIGEPLMREIGLPREGDSDEAAFDFTPRGAGASFEARITVMHRGRIIQTAVLRASVQPDARALQPGSEPRIDDFIPVRQSIGDLEHRRQFDLAFVLNHTSAGQPRAVALSANHAWIADLTEAKAVVKKISDKLTPVARSAADFAEGIKGEKGRALLIELAREGVLLRRFLVRDQLNAAGNQPGIAKQEYVQIVSTTHDAAIPFEFIYDFDAPEKTAKLCKKWVKGIDDGKLPEPCTGHTKDEVCPMGFWALQKVIERHQVSPNLASAGRAVFLQSEPSQSRPELALDGVSVFGASKRVPPTALSALAATIKTATGKKADQAKNWSEWVDAVKRSRPKLLIALAHSDGVGSDAGLEIGGESLADVMVTSSYVFSTDTDPSPLVALLGCDTVGTTDIYGNHARTFRGEGAAIVIATIATVLGEHAATVAESLVAGLLSKDAKAPTRVGEALRAIKREALLRKQMMPLCLVAYGDADWKIKRN